MKTPRNKLKMKPINYSIIYNSFTKYKIIYNTNQKICKTCFAPNLTSIKTPNYLMEPYNPQKRGHNLSNKLVNIFWSESRKLQQKYKDLLQEYNDLQQICNDLQAIVPRFKPKYSRRFKPMTKEDYEKEKQSIPAEDELIINQLEYHLLKESECVVHTGCSRTHLIYQAEQASISTESAYHCREKIYTMLSSKYRSSIYNIGKTTLLSHWSKALYALNKKYAKPRLINSGALENQHWRRENVKINTPDFVYRVLEISKDGIYILYSLIYLELYIYI